MTAKSEAAVIFDLAVFLERLLRSKNVRARAKCFAAGEASKVAAIWSDVKGDPRSRIKGAGQCDAVHDGVAEFQEFKPDTVGGTTDAEVRANNMGGSMVHVRKRLIDARVETANA